jgi:hypothetical protein
MKGIVLMTVLLYFIALNRTISHMYLEVCFHNKFYELLFTVTLLAAELA